MNVTIRNVSNISKSAYSKKCHGDSTHLDLWFELRIMAHAQMEKEGGISPYALTPITALIADELHLQALND